MPQVWGLTDTRVINQYINEQQGSLAYDIGANGGFLAYEILSPHFDKVVAIEPCVESYEHLEERAKGKDNIYALCMAVSDHEGTVDLGIKETTAKWGELFTGDSLDFWGPDIDKRHVVCATLDTIAAQVGMPDFVKIDTEGHEPYIIDGGHNVFETHPKFCIEVHSAYAGEYIKDYLDSINLEYSQVYHNGYQNNNPNRTQHYWLVG